MQEPPHGWAHDRDISLDGLRFHLGKHFIAWRKDGVEIIFDRAGGDAVLSPKRIAVVLSQMSLLNG